jgi:hypothetical protein
VQPALPWPQAVAVEIPTLPFFIFDLRVRIGRQQVRRDSQDRFVTYQRDCATGGEWLHRLQDVGRVCA